MLFPAVELVTPGQVVRPMPSYGKQKAQIEANRVLVLAALKARGTASARQLYRDLWESPSVVQGSKASRSGGAGLVTRILNRLEEAGAVESFYVGPTQFWRLL
jgi:hypothetical protein